MTICSQVRRIILHQDEHGTLRVVDVANGSFEHPNHMLKLMGKRYLQFYAQKFCLSKPVHYY